MKWFLYSLLLGTTIGIAGWIIAAPCYRFDHWSSCPTFDCDQVTRTLCSVYYCDNEVNCGISGHPSSTPYRVMRKFRFLGLIKRDDGSWKECAGRLALTPEAMDFCCNCDGYVWEPMP
jgi:hypothetical protein